MITAGSDPTAQSATSLPDREPAIDLRERDRVRDETRVQRNREAWPKVSTERRVGNQECGRLPLGHELDQRLLIRLVVEILKRRASRIDNAVGLRRKPRQHRIAPVSEQHRLDLAACGQLPG
jgi:hypothetical protein